MVYRGTPAGYPYDSSWCYDLDHIIMSIDWAQFQIAGYCQEGNRNVSAFMNSA